MSSESLDYQKKIEEGQRLEKKVKELEEKASEQRELGNNSKLAEILNSLKGGYEKLVDAYIAAMGCAPEYHNEVDCSEKIKSYKSLKRATTTELFSIRTNHEISLTDVFTTTK